MDMDRPSITRSGDNNMISYKDTSFSVGNASVVFFKTKLDPNSPTSCVGLSNPIDAERDFWISFITNPSQEAGSPYHIYNTVYLNLEHDNADGINYLFEDTGLKYMWVHKVLFLWLDTLGLSRITSDVSRVESCVESGVESCVE